MENQCIFCKIASKQIPAYIIYEDEKIMAILDIYPTNPGHTLIFPKQHITRYEDLPEEIIGRIFTLVKYIGASFKMLGYSDYNVIIYNGPFAGQKIDHFLTHVIPRSKGDGITLEFPKKAIKEEILQDILKKLKENLKIDSTKNIKETIKKDIDNKENIKILNNEKLLRWFKKIP